MISTDAWDSGVLSDLCSLRKETCNPIECDLDVYVGLEHIESGKFFLKRHGSPKEVKSTKNRFYAGDVIYGKLRPYLDKAVVSELEGICSTDILVFKPKNSVPPSFLAGILHCNKFIQHAVNTTHGVNHPRTSWKSLKDYGTKIPPLNEQQKIAAILLKIQQAIEVQESIIEAAQELKKSTMEHVFTYGLQGEKTKETEIGRVSESWKLKSLGDLVEVKGGKRLPRGKQLLTEETQYPYIRVCDLKNNSVAMDQLMYVPVDVQPQIKKYIINSKDIYISIAGTTGLVGIIPSELDGAQLTENAARLVLLPDPPDQKYLMRFLDSVHGQTQIESMTMKTSQPKLALARIKQIKVALPSSKDQIEIANIIQAIDNKIEYHTVKRSTLQDLFKTMLNKLMTGEIRVKALDIDTSCVLEMKNKG